MKEIQITIPAEKKSTLEEFITRFNVKGDYLENSETIVYSFNVPTTKINNALIELKRVGIGVVFGRIIIRSIVVITKQVDKTRFEESIGGNFDEILSQLLELSVLSRTYVILTTIGAALAALGLYYNSSLIIIASMIVSPLMGPIALTSIGLFIPGQGWFNKGVVTETVGIGTNVIMGIVIGGLLYQVEPLTELPYEILSRTDLELSIFLFSLVSGLAAGVVIAKGMDLSIVGVAIAASLAPPAANVGILLVLGYYPLALKSFMLLILNVLAINLACGLMFILFGVQETSGLSSRKAKQSIKLVYRVLIFVTLLIAIIGWFSYVSSPN